MSQDLIFTAITRFGTVLFIVYTIGVLLNVYRYVMRMAAYHEARAHALILASTHDEKHAKRFALMATVLAAEKIDFGKAPATPVEQLIELLKTAKTTVDKELSREPISASVASSATTPNSTSNPTWSSS